MNNPYGDGETAQDLAPRGSLFQTRIEPPHKPFVWPDEYDDQPVELTELLRTYLNANNREKAKEFVKDWLRMATHGNRTALRELLERVEGPAIAPVYEEEEE